MLDSATKHYKIAYYISYRFDEYANIHDYLIVAKSFLLLIFFGLTPNNFSKWLEAFQCEEDAPDSKELIQKILTHHMNDITS